MSFTIYLLSVFFRRSRNTGHYLLLNLSVRDILVAGLCIPFTLDSEIIHLTWNLGHEYCICFRSVYRDRDRLKDRDMEKDRDRDDIDF